MLDVNRLVKLEYFNEFEEKPYQIIIDIAYTESIREVDSGTVGAVIRTRSGHEIQVGRSTSYQDLIKMWEDYHASELADA